jgi:hypothetical protein
MKARNTPTIPWHHSVTVVQQIPLFGYDEFSDDQNIDASAKKDANSVTGAADYRFLESVE